MGLRHKYTPSEFFDQIYIQSGNSWYFDTVEPAAKAAIAKGASAYEVYQRVDQITAQYGANTNPIWNDYWTGNQALNKRVQTVAQMRDMLADPSTPKSPEADHLRQLVNLYYGSFLPLKTSGQYTAKDLKAQWGAAMSTAAARYPDMKGAIQSVFLGLG